MPTMILTLALVQAFASTVWAEDSQSANTIMRGCRAMLLPPEKAGDVFIGGVCTGIIIGLIYETGVVYKPKFKYKVSLPS